MKPLDLPIFDIPELTRKRLTPKAYQSWVLDNLKRLRAAGQLERLLHQPVRRPVNERFVVK